MGKEALATADSRAERRAGELLRTQRKETRASFVSIERYAEESVVQAECHAANEACVYAQRSTERHDQLAEDSARVTDELREELRAFMDEQRVFCGFLDTEQRSYQELVRHEMTALSRLVSKSLLGDFTSAKGSMLREPEASPQSIASTSLAQARDLQEPCPSPSFSSARR